MNLYSPIPEKEMLQAEFVICEFSLSFSAGILQHPDGTVLKQLQPPPRGPREMQFYSMVILTAVQLHISAKVLRTSPHVFSVLLIRALEA